MKGTNQLPATSRKSTGFTRAFTLTELLVVLCGTGMLAAVLLSVAFTTREQVMRAQCADNLRQIGVGLNVYANENNGYLPFSGWKLNGNPWETYLACRYGSVGEGPKTGGIIEGPYGFGSLFFDKDIQNPKIFYCPALVPQKASDYVFYYDLYADSSLGGWPSIPTTYAGHPYTYYANGNPYVRCGYNYYPQARATQTITFLHPFTVPALSYQRVTFTSPIPGDPSQVSLSVPVALNLATVNPRKSIVTDLVEDLAAVSHQASGSVAGLNALFPDGGVTFQNARTDPRTGFSSPWYPALWEGNPTAVNPATGPANNPSAFRIIMSEWQP